MKMKNTLLECWKVYGAKSMYRIFYNGREIGIVFKWGRRWCSQDFMRYTGYKTRYEAARKLVDLKK